MASDTTAQTTPVTESAQVPEPDLRLPTARDVIRAFGIIYGPPLVLDLIAAASAATLARWASGGRPACAAERRFRPFAFLGVGIAAAYLLAIRPWLRRWGATDDEVARTLPGDDLVPDPAVNSTWSVTIDAPAEDVWPWLAQIGRDRGGFYSYEWLENLAGCELRNADRIHPEWQERMAGEIVPLHPTCGLPLERFEPGRALVLNGWGAFVIDPTDEDASRLISRSRVPKGWAALSYALLLELPHFIMQRKMLLGIKARAEDARRRQAATGPPQVPARDRGYVGTLVPRRSGRLAVVTAPDAADTGGEMSAARSTG